MSKRQPLLIALDWSAILATQFAERTKQQLYHGAAGSHCLTILVITHILCSLVWMYKFLQNTPKPVNMCFKKSVIRSMSKVALLLGSIAGGVPALSTEQDPRLLSSREFLRELGKGAGAEKEISALSLRWAILSGVPEIKAAFAYHK